jgi:hypothetical protein
MGFLDQLLFMLQEQMNGPMEYIGKIQEFIKPLFREKVFRDETLTGPQLSAVEIVMREWQDMFSFEPGCNEGIPYIISLLKWLRYKPMVDPPDIYRREEWGKMIDLRGPVESVWEVECKNCHTHYYSMMLSGFLDIASFVCSKCGNVYFGSIYSADGQIPLCDCGGRYHSGCPGCSEYLMKTLRGMSPYQYFQSHHYIRGQGA